MASLNEITAILGGERLTPGTGLETECTKIFASDLMSDVLAYMEPESVLLTGLANFHAVRTACLLDATALIIVNGKRPDEKSVDEARANNLPVITTGLSMFEACSRISSCFAEGKR
jgi:predicted transcriptional regulator